MHFYHVIYSKRFLWKAIYVGGEESQCIQNKLAWQIDTTFERRIHFSLTYIWYLHSHKHDIRTNPLLTYAFFSNSKWNEWFLSEVMHWCGFQRLKLYRLLKLHWILNFIRFALNNPFIYMCWYIYILQIRLLVKLVLCFNYLQQWQPNMDYKYLWENATFPLLNASKLKKVLCKN